MAVALGFAPAVSAAANPELDQLKQQLDNLAAQGKAGAAQYWYVDEKTGKVHVAVLEGASDPATKAFIGTGRSGLVETHTVSAPVTAYVGGRSAPRLATQQVVHGGQRIDGGNAYCTTGFNLVVDGQPRTLTAGHCQKFSQTWDLGGVRLGEITSHEYPGRDIAFITRAADWEAPAAVRQADGSIQQITAQARPTLNQSVCKTGATSGTTCGTVTALDVTVNYGDGPVYGLAQTTAYAAPGDSGGSVYSTSTALALVSGGPQNGGNAFVYPIA
ncbi:hypothetical protein Misp01_55160 [Microtetraspora sp. NBRC 13810]|nr:hypothetical protein Misp01_55160 [Microtetraspora sp. NBRC 13810]